MNSSKLQLKNLCYSITTVLKSNNSYCTVSVNSPTSQSFLLGAALESLF